MARATLASPTAGARVPVAEAARKIAAASSLPVVGAVCAKISGATLTGYAKAAAVLHLSLLALSTFQKFAITPAQAASLTPLGGDAHLGLLLASGAATAFLTIAAGMRVQQNSQTSQSSRAIDEDKNKVASEPDAANLQGENFIPSRENALDWAELLARSSHDLRTPLNAVIGFSDVMQRELLGPIGHDQYRDYVRHIRSSGFALLQSTDDVLALTSLVVDPTRASRGIVDLQPILHEAWLPLHAQARGRGVKLDIVSDADDGDALFVHGDARAFKQALTNLLSQASEGAAPASTVLLGVSATQANVTVVLSYTIESNNKQRQHISNAAQDRPQRADQPSVMARSLLQLQECELVEQLSTLGLRRIEITCRRASKPL